MIRRGVIALLVVGAAAVALVGYRASYGNWPGQGEPERLGWCGRVYYPGTESRPWTEAMSQGRVYPTFRAPPLIGRQVYSDFRPEEVDRRRDAGETCGAFLHLRSGDEYRTYTLSGAP